MSSARNLFVLLLVSLAPGVGVDPSLAQVQDLSGDDWDVTGGHHTGPTAPDDESCDAAQDDEGGELQDCVLVRATPDLSSGTLVLEGSFCANPMVSIGTVGGLLETVDVFSSDTGFILADLSNHMAAGSAVVFVECSCGDCALDITLGNVGPTGPQGLPGAPGPTGQQGPQGIPGPAGEDGGSFNAQNVYVKSCVDSRTCDCFYLEDRVLGGGASCSEVGYPPSDGVLVDSYPTGNGWFARCVTPSSTSAIPSRIHIVCLCAQDPCLEPPNQPPIAAIDVNPPSPAYAGNGSVTVAFISESYDPDGDPITCYEWTIASSFSAVETNWGPDLSLLLRSYSVEQHLDVLLRVSDDTEGPCNASASFSPHYGVLTGYVICTNRPPIAQIVAISEDVQPNAVHLTLDGSTSADPDGLPIQSYHWDCGNAQQPTGVQATCVYPRAVQIQVFEVELVVQDYSLEDDCALSSEPARFTFVVPGLAS